MDAHSIHFCDELGAAIRDSFQERGLEVLESDIPIVSVDGD